MSTFSEELCKAALSEGQDPKKYFWDMTSNANKLLIYNAKMFPIIIQYLEKEKTPKFIYKGE